MKAGLIVVAAVAVAIAWLSFASMAFIGVNGFWSAYPWPDKLWMWARYAIEAPPNAIIHRWLVITAILASLPFALLGFGLLRNLQRKRGPASLYGKSDFATQPDLDAGGLKVMRSSTYAWVIRIRIQP